MHVGAAARVHGQERARMAGACCCARSASSSGSGAGRELRRWELYAGLLVQAAVIGPWIYEVTATAAGHRGAAYAVLAQRGRTLHAGCRRRSPSTTRPAITTRLQVSASNSRSICSPGRCSRSPRCAAPGAARAWPAVAGRPWRFAIGATVPFLLLLSVAATARDIYAAPVLLGFGFADRTLGRRARSASPTTSRFDRFALRATVAIVTVLIAVLRSHVRRSSRWPCAQPSRMGAVAALAAIAVGVGFRAVR